MVWDEVTIEMQQSHNVAATIVEVETDNDEGSDYTQYSLTLEIFNRANSEIQKSTIRIQ